MSERGASSSYVDSAAWTVTTQKLELMQTVDTVSRDCVVSHLLIAVSQNFGVSPAMALKPVGRWCGCTTNHETNVY